MKNRVQNEQPTIVPVTTFPTLPQNGPMPTPRPDMASGVPMAPASPVAPSVPATSPMPKMASAPVSSLDLLRASPSEITASARQMYREPGNAVSAFAQGFTNAQALKAQQERELALKERDKAKAEAEAAKQIDYLDRMSPELANAARMGFMSPQEAYTAFRTEKASGGKRTFKEFQDGSYGWINEATGEVDIIGNAAKPQDANSAIGKLAQDYANGLINDEQYKQGLADMAPKGMTIESDGQGGFRMVQGAGVGGPGPMREGEAKANIYASRMEKSEPILSNLEKEGTSLWNSIMSGVPVMGNYALSPEYRQYDQAKRDFINATLRQESGAVIADTEFENAEKQYFPQPGDDPATIAQKKENRRTAMIAIRQASGQESTSDLTPTDAQVENRATDEPQSAAPSGAPEIGTVVDGYTFKGGDPADPASWERAL